MPGFVINGQGRGPNATIETVRTHRWRFEFPQIRRLEQVVLYAMSCQRPTPQIDMITMHNGQTQIHMPGKYKWNPINAKFYERADRGAAVQTSTRDIFMYWAHGGNSVVDFTSNTVNKQFRAIAKIFLDDGVGRPVHIYTLKNIWPQKITPSELNYTSSEIATIQVTFVYDSADEGEIGL